MQMSNRCHLVETAGLFHQHRRVSEAAVLSCGLYNTVSLGHIMPPWQPTSMFCVNNKLSWREKKTLFNLNDHFAWGSACLYLWDCQCTTALPPSDTNPSETWRTRPLTLDTRLFLKHRPDKYFLLIFNIRMSVGQLFLCKDSTLLEQKHQYIAWYCKNSFSHTIPDCTCTSQRHMLCTSYLTSAFTSARRIFYSVCSSVIRL